MSRAETVGYGFVFGSARVSVCGCSCPSTCDGGCTCLPVDRGPLTPPSVLVQASLPSDSLTALPCPAQNRQEVGRWEEGRSQDISLLPSLLLTVCPSAVASPRDPKPHQTGLWALRTPPHSLT